MTRDNLLNRVIEFQEEKKIEQLISANEIFQRIILSEDHVFIQDAIYELTKHKNRIQSAIDFIYENFDTLEKFEEQK